MPASWVLLAQQPGGLDIEDPDPHDRTGAARIDFPYVHDFFIVGRPVDDPAAGGCQGGDPGAGPRLRLRLLTGRHSRNPDPALAWFRQVTWRDAERRPGCRGGPDLRTGGRVHENDSG